MSEILLRWLNEDVKLSTNIDSSQFTSSFCNGFLIGELLHRFGLQNDFHLFSQSRTPEAKLNNFSRIEPTLALLAVKFDSNMAKDIINERPGMASRLLYQLFIALGKKSKMNITGFAMEAMRPQGPARLGVIETELYKERLKTLVPRQVDLNFEELVLKYNKKQKENDDKATKARMEEEEKLKGYQQNIRQQGIERSRKIREEQESTMAKIKDAIIKIPKPPESKKTSGLTKKEYEKKKEVEGVFKCIDQFEKRLKNPVTSTESSNQIREIDADIEMFLNESPTKHVKVGDFVKPEKNEDYITKIRQRLNEDSHARKEREKRRRSVLVQQFQAHEAQQDATREDQLVNRLMRQSQVERRIAIQLMHIRNEKETIKKNRMEKERQFTERRLKDFQDALDREAEMCRLAKIEYEEEVQRNKELHDAIANERARQKYEKRYGICQEILLSIVDFSCKVGEYRELTEKLLPPKLVREWKALFMNSKPLYDTEVSLKNENEITEEEELQIALEAKQALLDDEDFTEYKNFVGEWLPLDGSNQPPADNAVLGFILQRLINIRYPPTPPPEDPKFPAFPIKACVLGKFFSGKTSALRNFAESHRVEIIDLQEVVEEALQAWNEKEQKEIIATDEDEIIKAIDSCLANAEEGQIDNNVVKESAMEGDVVPIPDDGINKEEKISCSEATGGEVENKDGACVESEKKEEVIDNEVIPKEESQTVLTVNSKEMLTTRAQLGAKANNFLRKSKAVPDALLVDIMVDRLRDIPDGTGWIMDGFPANLQQAKLLEKALTGYDPVPSPLKTRDGKRNKKSKLAPDPTPLAEVKRPVSGINVVVFFDVPDEVVLKRAEGRKYDAINGKVYHEEFNPPPEGAYTGLQNKPKVQSVIDLSNDKEQAQVRITSFQDNWPKLEKWFQKFDILEQLDADIENELVAEKLNCIFEQTIEKLKTPPPPPVPTEGTTAATGENESQADAKTEQRCNVEKVNSKDAVIPPEPSPSLSKHEVKDVPPKNTATKGKKTAKGNESPSPVKANRDKNSPSPKKGKKDKKERSPSPKKRGDSGQSSSPTKSDGDVDAPEEPERPPSPEPGTLEWEYVDQPIELEFVEILLSNWDIVEDGYIRACKHVFRNIRIENENIYQYFYKTRKLFVKFLKRPDAKQIFVSDWQKDYNAFPEDMRSDEEAKAELHHRVDDLCDRLWDICDDRKEEAEQERCSIMTEGWLEDRIGIIVNHFISLMQTEIDRYQQTCKMLKDYYIAMEIGNDPEKVKRIIETIPTFTRIPLVDLPVTNPPKPIEAPVDDDISHLSSVPSSVMASKQPSKTPELAVEENEERRIPLVPRRPGSIEVSPSRSTGRRATPKKDKSSEDKMESPVPPTDPDEKLLHDAIMVALAAIETQIAGDFIDEENELAATSMKQGKEDVSKSSSKEKKAKKDSKSKSPAKSKPQSKARLQQTTPVPSAGVDTTSEEDRIKVAIQTKMRKEYKKVIHVESMSLKIRLEAIKMCSSRVLRKLKEKSESTYGDLDNWLGKRFLQEMESIGKMCEVIRQAIEKEELLQNASVLEDKEFFIDDDLHVYKTPTPPPTPSPKEEIYVDMFTCTQLDALNIQFCEIAPFGMIPVKMFNDIMMSLPSSTVGLEAIPEVWINITPRQLEKLSEIVSINNEYINRRSFMLTICKPYPEPTISELMETAELFKAIDGNNLGFITKDDFMKCEIWLDEHQQLTSDATKNGYNRVQNMKQIIFNIFAMEKAEGELLDYMDMLLYFVHCDVSLDGLLSALSIVIGTLVPSPMTTEDLQEEENVTETEKDAEVMNIEENHAEEEPTVNIDQWITVFNHGKCGHGGDHRFNVEQRDSLEKTKEALSTVYEDLGFTRDEPCPILLLYTHPVMRDLISACIKYQSQDIAEVFKMELPNEDQLQGV